MFENPAIRRAGLVVGIAIMVGAGVAFLFRAFMHASVGWVFAGVGCLVLAAAFFIEPRMLFGANAQNRNAQIVSVVGSMLIFAGAILGYFV